jgi:hypothetical protein
MSGVSRNYPEGTGKLLRFEYNETDEMVVTQRTPQNAYLLVDSIDRYILTRDGLYDDENEINPNDIYISHQKLNGFGEIKRVFVSDVYFPWRTPNVNIRNNLFELRINGVDYYLTVPEDFYKPSELASTMQTIANGATGFRTIASIGTTPVYTTVGQPWSITADAIGRFTITATGATFSTETVLRTGLESDLNNIMNYFVSNPPVATARGAIASMTYTKYIDFVSTNLTKHQRLKDCLTQFNYTNIIYRLYLNNENQLPLTDDTYFASRPSDIYRQVENPKTIMWNKNEMISAIDIKLYDDGGELLYIPPGDWDTNYLMTIQLSES